MVLFVADERLSEARAREIAATTPGDGCPELERVETIDYVNTHRAVPVVVRLGAAVALLASLLAVGLF
jgi:hypothetical protein